MELFSEINNAFGQSATAMTAVSDALNKFAPTHNSAENTSYPGDDCCDLYYDKNLGGSTMTKCLDPNADSLKFFSLATPSFNDRLSSWWCGKNVVVRFCKDNT